MQRSEVVKWLYTQNIHLLKLQKGTKIPLEKSRGVYDAKRIDNSSRFDNFNIGVACGNGLVIVDVDPRNNGNLTLANWQTGDLKIPETITVRTAQGGLHFYLRGNIPNTKFEGIDIISGGKYVVGPTSVVGGVEYAFEKSPEDGFEFAAVPDWLTGLCEKKKKTSFEAALNETADLDELENLLVYIDPDVVHDDWINVGMALHHTNSGDMGFDLWLRWSQGLLTGQLAKKFKDEQALIKRWKSFDKDGGITAGTIYHLAREGIAADIGICIQKKEMSAVTSIPVGSEVALTSTSMKQLPIPVNGILADLYNEFMNKAYEPIPVFALGASLSVMSALTQTGYIIRGVTLTRSYNLILGEAGTGKNDYLEIARSILSEVASRSGNVELLGEEIRSAQGLKAMLSEYPTRALIIDEWTDFLERVYSPKVDSIGEEILSLVKKLWGGLRELEGSRTRNKNENIKKTTEPRVTILGAGVPDKFISVLDKRDFIEGGLMSRIELWYHKEIPELKYKDNYKAYEHNHDLIKNLTSIFTEPMSNGVDTSDDCKITQVPRSRTILVSEEAKRLMVSEFNHVNNMDLDKEKRSVFRRLLERLEMYAGIYAIGRSSCVVEASDLNDFAIPLFQYHCAQFLELLEKKVDSEWVNKINVIIKHIPKNRFISARELTNMSTPFKMICSKMPERIEYLRWVASQGYIEMDSANSHVRRLTKSKH